MLGSSWHGSVVKRHASWHAALRRLLRSVRLLLQRGCAPSNPMHEACMCSSGLCAAPALRCMPCALCVSAAKRRRLSRPRQLHPSMRRRGRGQHHPPGEGQGTKLVSCSCVDPRLRSHTGTSPSWRPCTESLRRHDGADGPRYVSRPGQQRPLPRAVPHGSHDAGPAARKLPGPWRAGRQPGAGSRHGQP